MGPLGIAGAMALGQSAGTLTNGLLDRASTELGNQVFGSPADDAAELMDRLYPGTTPLERLNAGGGGAAALAPASSVGSKMQQANVRSAEAPVRAAKTSAQASKDVAKINQDTQKNTNRASIIGKIIDAQRVNVLGTGGNQAGGQLNDLLQEYMGDEFQFLYDSNEGANTPENNKRSPGLNMLMPWFDTKAFSLGKDIGRKWIRGSQKKK